MSTVQQIPRQTIINAGLIGIIGILLVMGGLFSFAVFLLQDVSVPGQLEHANALGVGDIGSTRVVNIDLLATRQTGLLISSATAMTGILLVAASLVLRGLLEIGAMLGRAPSAFYGVPSPLPQVGSAGLDRPQSSELNPAAPTAAEVAWMRECLNADRAGMPRPEKPSR